jgi:hypothetical protein
MSAIGGGGHYISDGAIMTWLAKEQDRIYGELDQSMDLSDKRAKFSDDLNNIKAELQQANDSKNFTKVDADLQNFMKTYGSDPELGDYCKGLQGMFDRIHTDLQAQTTWDTTQAANADMASRYTQSSGAHAKSLGVYNSTATGKGQLFSPPEGPRPEQHYSDDDMKSWQDLISGKTDVTGKNDQLTMIHIQELKATLDQSSQLGSTFISSGDKTSSAIINNIA